MEQKKLIISIGSAVLILITLLGLWLSPKTKELDINSDLVKDLYKEVNPSEDAIVLSSLYKDGISNDYMLAIGIKNYINNQEGIVERISAGDVEKSIKEILGNDVNIIHKDTYILTSDYCRFDYDEIKEQYNNISGCGGDWYNFFYRKIISASETKNELTIIEKSIYVYYEWDDIPIDYGHVTIYNNINDKKNIKSYDQNPNESLKIDIDDYLDEASTYKYTFQKVGNKYIFKNFELVK